MLEPRVRVVRCATKTHPCPTCGKRRRRKRHLRRRIRSLAYRQEAFLEVHYAEHEARRGCRESFRSWALDVPAKAAYDDLVRAAVHDRLLDDGLNGERQKTNNHVERTNRRLRFDEKVHYKRRRRKSIARFVLLRISRHVPRPKTLDQHQPPPPGGG